MCCEDVKIGQHTKPEAREVLVGTTPTEVCSASPYRSSLLFGGSGPNPIFFTPVNPATAGVGLPITSSSGPIYLDRDHYGSITQWAWYASCPVAGTTVLVIEGHLHGICEQ